ncbi:hypothetical protein MMC06_003152 [Schaereria dolodes]|nr:hypothetical protein [Schaereria dolodes]
MGLLNGKNQFLVDGKTVVITGGSQGLGKSVARLLAQKGANVLIVARNVEKLKAALQYISAGAVSSSQRLHFISADLTSSTECSRVISEAISWNNEKPIDIVWCCAGSSHPTLFIDTPVEKLKEQMDSNYFSSAYIAHAILRSWLKQKPTAPASDPKASSPSKATSTEPRHLIFTSSVLAFYPIIGYGPYSPPKCALRSLSDTLSQELNLYSSSSTSEVKLHTIFPGTIFTDSYEEENKIKPGITKKLEEDDGGQSPDEVAARSVRGLERGEELITTALLGRAMKVSALGASRRIGWGFVDTIFGWLVSVIMIYVRIDMDEKVRKWGGMHGSSGNLR